MAFDRALAEAFEQGYRHGCQLEWETIRYRDDLIFPDEKTPWVPIAYRNPYDPDDILIKERAG